MAPSAQVQRAQAAVKAMKLIGFDQGRAKTVLKKLLKIYEDNWEHIEAENYRLLADSILDDQESGEPNANGTDVAASAPELSHKRLRHHQDDPGPLPLATGAVASEEKTTRGKRLKPMEAQCSHEEEGAPSSPHKDGVAGEIVPQRSNSCEEPSPNRVHIGSRVTRSKSITLQLDKEKSDSPPMHGRDKHKLSGKSGTLVCYKEPKIEQNIEGLIEITAIGFSTIPDENALCDVSDNYDLPLALCPPQGNPSEISGANMIEAPNNWNGEETREPPAQEEMTSNLSSKQERFSTNTDIASSITGEVKIALTYSSDCPNFKVPSLESIFEIVEDRCLKSYKVLQPDFSLMNLMKEICQCAVDLAADSSKEKQEKVKMMTRRSFGTSMDLVASEVPRISFNSFESSQIVNGGIIDMLENSALEPACYNDSQSLAVIPLQEHSITVPRSLHDESDIAKGEESVRISLINEFTGEKFPPYFHYIPRNAVYQNAHVNFSLARIDDEQCCLNCFGDCLSAPIPCACTRETGGEFLYTLDGLLKREFLDECISMNRDPDKHHHVYCKVCPIEKFKNEHNPDACKGHLVRKFIKECWSKCGCSKHCGNRVVQRGIARNLQVFFSADGKGWGLRTLEELPRGAFICEYVGEILTNIELYDRTIQETGGAKHTYPVLLDADWGSEAGLRDEEALCLDATFYGNVGRFVNHRCYDSNLVEVPVEWETPDHHYYHLAYFTTRKVEILEELTWDYGIDFGDRSHPIKAFKCLCGSRFCRDRRRSRGRSRASGSK